MTRVATMAGRPRPPSTPPSFTVTRPEGRAMEFRPRQPLSRLPPRIPDVYPVILPPMTEGVDFPVIRRRFEKGATELLHCCAISPSEVASRSACRFAARSRSSMQEEAGHSLTGTDGCSPAAGTTTAVRIPSNHCRSVTARCIGLPLSGCKFARRALRCASRPPPFQVPCNFPSQTAVKPCALCSA